MKYPQSTSIYDGKEYVFTWMNGVDFKEYAPVTQSYGIVINEEKEILLGKRPGKGHWNLPGGTPEEGENLILTLKRELLEEVDVEVVKAYELGMQKVCLASDESKVVYQARYVVPDYKLLAQTSDPDSGEMWERKFFPYYEVSGVLKWGNLGQQMIRDAMDLIRG